MVPLCAVNVGGVVGNDNVVADDEEEPVNDGDVDVDDADGGDAVVFDARDGV